MGSIGGARAGFPALLLVAACGGKLLPFPSAAADGASRDDAGAPVGASEDASAVTSGSSGSSGGSSGGSSSSGTSYSSSSGSSGAPSSGGGASIFASSGGIPEPCLSASDCPSGRVCCADIDLRTGCFVGTCPSTSAGPIQLCVRPSECAERGDSCTSLAIAPQDAVTACRALP